MKSLFLPDNEDTYEQQAKFDSQVAKLKEFDFKVYSINPPNIAFEKAVKETRQNISIKMTEILNYFIKSKTLL